MWQEKQTLAAENVRLDENTGKLLCSGKVKSAVPYMPKEGKEERLEVAAETMSFDPDENVISFRRESSLKLKNIQLRASSILIHLKEEGGEMERIVAKRKVIIDQNGRRGRGQEGIYSFEKDTFVLLGNPVLTDKNKGQIRGGKLTFYIGDGRIVVENRERERSVTDIKS